MVLLPTSSPVLPHTATLAFPSAAVADTATLVVELDTEAL